MIDLKKLKKGQKVWSFLYKKYMYVSMISTQGAFLAPDETLLIDHYHDETDFSITAIDMFKELGYRQGNSGDNEWLIRYVKLLGDEEGTANIISFWGESKTYDATEMEDDHNWGLDITNELHLAITQQRIEMGWV